MKSFIAFIHLFLNEFVKLVAVELPDVPEQVLVDAFISCTGLEVDRLFAISLLRLSNLRFNGFLNVNFEFESVLIQHQFAGLLQFILVDHHKLPEIARVLSYRFDIIFQAHGGLLDVHWFIISSRSIESLFCL